MQRKRHINFKDFLSTSGSILNLGQRIGKSKLHSIPKLSSNIINDNKAIQYDDNNLMKNNLKSNVLYSIPCVKSCACTFCRVVKKANDDSSTSNPTRVVWWRSQNRISRSARAVILTRASQVVITPLSRIRSWMDPYSRISSWRKLNSFIYHTNPANLPTLAILLLSISFLSILGSMVVGSESCYATNTTLGDSTASMTLDTSDAVVNVSVGQTGYASKSIVVSTNNTESYALTITAPATLKNSSTNSTNPWSYAYGQSGSIEDMSYTTFDGSTKQLEAGVESDGKAKVLAFSSTFAEGLSSGHYKAEVTLALTATPKATATAKWLWSTDGSEVGVDSGITTMQQMTPEVCNQVSTPTAVGTPGGTKAPTLVLSDSRDGSTYTIAKLPDGRCWMTQNLNLRLSTTKALTSTDSDIDSDDSSVSSWTPTQNTIVGKDNLTSTDFSNSDYYKAQSYADSASATTTYYSWTAATAGAGTSSVTANGANVSSSICPRGWTLPTGLVVGANTTNDFYNLFSKMNLGVAVGTSGSTSWGTSQGLAISQASPYNFAYTGLVRNGSLTNTSIGYWWSRTASSDAATYYLYINSNYVNPGTNSNLGRYAGLPVRCVVAEPKVEKTFTITYVNETNSTAVPAPQTCTTTSDSCTITISSEQLKHSCDEFLGWDITNKSSFNPSYSLGQSITITKDTTLYAIWFKDSCYYD